MILYLTGLNSVDPEQIEAARLDGAKGLRMLWHVILPQLRPATFIAFVVTVIGSLRSFDLISIMTNGGPFGSSRVLSFYMFEKVPFRIRFQNGLWRRDCGDPVSNHDGIHWLLSCGACTKMRKPLTDEIHFCSFGAITDVSQTHRKIITALGSLDIKPSSHRDVLWLAPLLAVALFSIRPDSDFLVGNYWGWPSSFEMTKNYGMVFGSAMPRYIMNSFLITIPTVIGAVALSCMTGFALGVYKFRGNLLVFLHVHCRQFRALSNPHGACARPDARYEFV